MGRAFFGERVDIPGYGCEGKCDVCTVDSWFLQAIGRVHMTIDVRLRIFTLRRGEGV